MSSTWESDAREAGSSTRPGSGNGGQGAAATAKERAGETATAASEGAKQVAADAKTQVRNVAEEATVQAGRMYETSRRELMDQADQRARKAAEGLRSWSDQLGALASGRTDQAGQVMEYVQDAQQRLAGLASRVEEGGISGIADDLASFARRRPLVFLGAAGFLGFAIGRVVRSAAGQNGSPNGSSRSEVQRLSSPHAELAPPLRESPVLAEAAPGQPVDVPGSSW